MPGRPVNYFAGFLWIDAAIAPRNWMAKHPKTPMTPVDSNKAALVARRGATRLLRLVLDDGRFVYSYSAAGEPKPTRKYNVLRHCGAAWSMLDTARQLGEMTAVEEGAERAIRYLIANFLVPFGDGGLCVLDSGKIKLGGNGLALLALTELFSLRKDEDLLAAACRLGRYIVSEQQADGDFVHSRVLETGEVRDFRSDYYTGEALFGLVRLYEATGDRHWLDRVVFSEAKLRERDYGVEAQSHWMLYALDALFAVRPSAEYLEHAGRIAANILAHPRYRDERRSAPIACRSEGLLAYMRMLERADPSGISPSASECLRAIQTNLGLQMEFQTANGAFIRGGGSDEVRIDYIQHNISSFLAYSRLPVPAAAVAA